jgi:hypothetical protein
MFRKLLNQLMINGLWYATMIIHMSTAFITTMLYTLIAFIIKWFGKNT